MIVLTGGFTTIIIIRAHNKKQQHTYTNIHSKKQLLSPKYRGQSQAGPIFIGTGTTTTNRMLSKFPCDLDKDPAHFVLPLIVEFTYILVVGNREFQRWVQYQSVCTIHILCMYTIIKI